MPHDHTCVRLSQVESSVLEVDWRIMDTWLDKQRLAHAGDP